MCCRRNFISPIRLLGKNWSLGTERSYCKWFRNCAPYGFRDILVLKIVKRLLDAGISLQNIRTAVTHLRGRGVTELESITLMSDGASIYECASADEIIDLLQGGQGVFGIAVGKVWHEVEGSLSVLQGEINGQLVGGQDNDELSLRRKSKGA